MTLGNLDSNGIGRYDETTPIGTTWSAFMNLALATVSAALNTIVPKKIVEGVGVIPSSASARRKTASITFPSAYPSGVTPRVVVQSTVAASGTVIGAEAQSPTNTGFLLVVSVADGGTFGTEQSFAYIASGSRFPA